MCGAVSNRGKSSGGRAPRPFACFSGDSGVFASYCFCVFEDAAGYGKDGNRNFADICTVVLRRRMVLRKTHGANFLLLLAVSGMSERSLQSGLLQSLTAFVLCAGGGMFGGMVAS